MLCCCLLTAAICPLLVRPSSKAFSALVSDILSGMSRQSIMDNWQLAGQILASLVTSRPTTAQWESLGLILDILSNIDLSLYCLVCSVHVGVWNYFWRLFGALKWLRALYLMLKYKVVCSFWWLVFSWHSSVRTCESAGSPHSRHGWHGWHGCPVSVLCRTNCSLKSNSGCC